MCHNIFSANKRETVVESRYQITLSLILRWPLRPFGLSKSAGFEFWREGVLIKVKLALPLLRAVHVHSNVRHRRTLFIDLFSFPSRFSPSKALKLMFVFRVRAYMLFLYFISTSSLIFEKKNGKNVPGDALWQVKFQLT